MLGLLLGNFLGFLHEPVAPNGLLSTFRGGETWIDICNNQLEKLEAARGA